MNFSQKLQRRLRWLKLPTVTLITLLQRTPALPAFAAVEKYVLASPVVAVLRSLATVGSLGALHSLAGATTLSTSTPGPLNATVGQPVTTVAFTVLDTINIASWKITGSIPPGLVLSAREGGASVTDPGTLDATTDSMFDGYGGSISGNMTTTPILSGIPTKAGTYSIGLQAFEFSALGGLASNTFNYTVVVGGAPASGGPAFTTQPASQTVGAGASATFSVAVSGTPAPTLQWQKDGVAIAGATSSTLTLTNVSAANAGTYTVVATNSAGSATSSGAVLTVSTASGTPSIATQPQGVTVNAGGMVALAVTANGSVAPGFQWRKNGANIAGATSSTLMLNNVSGADAGAYTVVLSNSAGSVTSATANLAITAGQISRISNLSVRTNLGSGGSLTVGFVTSGTKNMLIRAVGPSLKTVFGIPTFFADPQFTLAASGVPVDSNDSWNSSLAPVFASLGAFPLDNGSKDAALMRAITGPMTAQVSGTGSGTMLVEVYDDDPATAGARLTNVSARNQVGTGADVLVSGFVIDGSAARTVLIRGIGPGLHDVFGVGGVLADPILEIHTTINGQDTVVTSNDNWSPDLAPVFSQVGAYQFLPGSKDAALVVTLPPGVYTAQVAGANSGTGDGVVEVYEVK